MEYNKKLQTFYQTTAGEIFLNVFMRYMGRHLKDSDCPGIILGGGYPVRMSVCQEKGTFKEDLRSFTSLEKQGVRDRLFYDSVSLGALPLVDKSMGFALLIHMPPYKHDKWDVFGELWRVLKDYGAVILVTPRKGNIWRGVWRLWDMEYDHFEELYYEAQNNFYYAGWVIEDDLSLHFGRFLWSCMLDGKITSFLGKDFPWGVGAGIRLTLLRKHEEAWIGNPLIKATSEEWLGRPVFPLRSHIMKKNPRGS